MSPYNSLTESQLISLLKKGDQHAFTEIYNRYFQLLYLHAYNRLKDKDEAKDLIQELFSFLWLKHDVIEFKQNLSNYLYVAVRNRVLNHIAHNKVKYRYELSLNTSFDSNYVPTDTRLRERLLAAIIEEEIQLLPDKMRLVFELSRKEHLSHKQIAEKLSLSEQTVRSHIKHALRLLRTKLGITTLLYCLSYFHKL